MLDYSQLKREARERLYVNKIFLLVMFVALRAETGGSGFFPTSLFITALTTATVFSLIIKIALKIILAFAISFTITNIVNLVRDAIYLEMAKSKEAVNVATVPEKIESLWLFGFLAGWALFLKIALYIIFFPAAIIKWLEYSQTYFILADDPKIGVKGAMLISKKITDGKKKELAFLFLSFFGWFILTLSSFGIVLIYLIPYMRLTFANAYLKLKEEAIKSGKIGGALELLGKNL